MSQLYRVVLTGKKLNPDDDQIRQEIEAIFDLPESQLKALLSGRALTIKKSISEEVANKFKKALVACGLECVVEPMADKDTLNTPDLEAAQDQVAGREVVPEKKSSARLVMAPAGARIGPRPSIVKTALPNVDHLEAGLAERLAPESKQGPPPPNVDHLQTANHDRLAPESEKGPAPPNVDHIDVAEPGASMSENKQHQPLALDLSHLSLKDEKLIDNIDSLTRSSE